MLPQAYVSHRTLKRLRIKIAQKRGDTGYFKSLQDKFSHYREFEVLQVNARTGSLLTIDDHIDIDDIAAFAESERLFTLKTIMPESMPLSKQIVEPFADVSYSLKRFSGGYLDLPGTVFLALLGFGVYEILKGRFITPPWYTFFWYAFGVFSKTIADNFQKETLY
jgi:hypothetical protein